MNRFLLATLLFVSAYALATANASAILAERPVAVLVYNSAEVPPAELSAAEKLAEHILREAGVATLWSNCLPSASDSSPDDSCNQALASLHLQVQVSRQPAPQFRFRDSVSGFAITDPSEIGPACYAFHDRTAEIAETFGVSHYLVLGEVFAHEIGHLLLGANSHSPAGVMSAVFDREKIVAGGMGRLRFTFEQAKKMRSMISQTSENLRGSQSNQHAQIAEMIDREQSH